MKKKRLFVDMDGTVAVFKQVDTLETLYEQGYFLNLEPHTQVIDAMKKIIKESLDIEVFILSSVLADSRYALEEKNQWLDKYLPEIDMEHRIFPPCGVSKRDHIQGGIDENDWLLDDYTYNLNQWQPPGRGIKLLNGINHTKGTWKHEMVSHDKESLEIAESIVDIIQNSAFLDKITLEEKVNREEPVLNAKKVTKEEGMKIFTEESPKGIFYYEEYGKFHGINTINEFEWNEIQKPDFPPEFDSLKGCLDYLNKDQIAKQFTNELKDLLQEDKLYLNKDIYVEQIWYHEGGRFALTYGDYGDPRTIKKLQNGKNAEFDNPSELFNYLKNEKWLSVYPPDMQNQIAGKVSDVAPNSVYDDGNPYTYSLGYDSYQESPNEWIKIMLIDDRDFPYQPVTYDFQTQQWNWSEEPINKSFQMELPEIPDYQPEELNEIQTYIETRRIEIEQEEDDYLDIYPVEDMPEGWEWHCYNDGSGSLQTPDGKTYVKYDLSTSEYNMKGNWHFFDGYPYYPESLYEFQKRIENGARSELSQKMEDLEALEIERDMEFESAIEIYQENNDVGLKVYPAKDMPEGWEWHCYEDGSGSLKSPDGKRYVQYDLSTSQYENAKDEWFFFDGYPDNTESFDEFQQRIESMALSELTERLLEMNSLSNRLKEYWEEERRNWGIKHQNFIGLEDAFFEFDGQKYKGIQLSVLDNMDSRGIDIEPWMNPSYDVEQLAEIKYAIQERRVYGNELKKYVKPGETHSELIHVIGNCLMRGKEREEIMNLSENDIKEYGLHISDSDAKYYKEHLHELLEEEKTGFADRLKEYWEKEEQEYKEYPIDGEWPPDDVYNFEGKSYKAMAIDYLVKMDKMGVDIEPWSDYDVEQLAEIKSAIEKGVDANGLKEYVIPKETPPDFICMVGNCLLDGKTKEEILNLSENDIIHYGYFRPDEVDDAKGYIKEYKEHLDEIVLEEKVSRHYQSFVGMRLIDTVTDLEFHSYNQESGTFTMYKYIDSDSHIDWDDTPQDLLEKLSLHDKLKEYLRDMDYINTRKGDIENPWKDATWEDKNPHREDSSGIIPEEKKDPKEALKETIEQGIRSVMDSEKFKNWLNTKSKLYYNNYSFNNAMSVWMTDPDASYVMGYEAWKDFGRQVRQKSDGEKMGIPILKPVMAYEKSKGGFFRMIKHSLTKQFDENPELQQSMYRLGQTNLEFTMNKVNKLIGFRVNGVEQKIFKNDAQVKQFIERAILGKQPMYFSVGTVFDVKDVIVPEYLWVKRGYTKDELVLDDNNQPIKNKRGEYKIMNTPERQARFEQRLDTGLVVKDPVKMGKLFDVCVAVSEKNGVPVHMRHKDQDETLANGAKGYFSRMFSDENPNGYIVIDESLENTEKCAVLFHEVGHSDMHKNLEALAQKMGEERIPRNMIEIQAEAVAYMTASTFGIETDTSSFSYLAAYTNGFELQDFQKSIEVIYSEYQNLSKEIKNEFDIRGLNIDLTEKESRVLSKKEIEKICQKYIPMTQEYEKRILANGSRLPALAADHIKNPEMIDIIKAQQKNIEGSKEYINTIIQLGKELENNMERGKQEFCISSLEAAYERLEQNINDFEELKEQLNHMRGQTNDLRVKFELDPMKTISEMKEYYPSLAKLTEMQTHYISTSTFIANEYASLLSKSPKSFVDEVCNRINHLDNITSKNGTFIEINKGGILSHPKAVTNELLSEQYKSDCTIFSVVKTETGKELAFISTEMSVSNENPINLLKQIYNDKAGRIEQEIYSNLKNAMKEEINEKKSYRPERKIMIAETERTIDETDKTLDSWKEEIDEKKSDMRPPAENKNRQREKDSPEK